MMKFVTLALGLCLAAGLAVAGDAEPWFDLANCDMCKHMLTPEGMLDELGWEHYVTASGAFAVTVVPANRAKDWAAAKSAMMAAGEKMSKGEPTKMCNFCKSMGGLMMSGKMQMEHFDTIGGEVMLMSSTDPATVEAIHKHVKRTTEEMKKMMAAPSGTR